MVMPHQKFAWGISIKSYEDAQHLAEQFKQGTSEQVSYQQLVDELLTDYSEKGCWRDYRQQARNAQQAFDNAFTHSELDDCNQQPVQGLKKLFESLNQEFEGQSIDPGSRLFAYLDFIVDEAKNRELIGSHPQQVAIQQQMARIGGAEINGFCRASNERQTSGTDLQDDAATQLRRDTEQQMGQFYQKAIKPGQRAVAVAGDRRALDNQRARQAEAARIVGQPRTTTSQFTARVSAVPQTIFAQEPSNPSDGERCDVEESQNPDGDPNKEVQRLSFSSTTSL